MSRRCPIQPSANCGRGMQTTRTALPSLAADRSDTCTSPRTVGATRRAWTPCVRCVNSPVNPPIRRLQAPPAIPSCFKISTAIAHPNKSHRYSEARSLSQSIRFDQDPGRGPSSRAWVGIWCSLRPSTPGRVPSYDEIEPQIKAAWLDEQRAAARQRAFEAMKAHYEIRLPEAPRIATAPDATTAKSTP